jgi:hypothetical protein
MERARDAHEPGRRAHDGQLIALDRCSHSLSLRAARASTTGGGSAMPGKAAAVAGCKVSRPADPMTITRGQSARSRPGVSDAGGIAAPRRHPLVNHATAQLPVVST